MVTELQEGDKAPPFSISTEQGELSSESLKGKPYVLYFYPKDDTSGCTKEAIEFSENMQKFSALGLTVVGVSKDSVDSHRKFKKKYDLKVPLGSDPDKKIAQQFGVWVQKKLYGRTYMGMDRATFLVDRLGVIRGIWRKVRVPGHVDTVLEAGRALAGEKLARKA